MHLVHGTSRKRPRSVSTVCTAPKRACRPSTPVLPIDVWHTVANQLPPSALVNLGRTNSQLHSITASVLRRKLWHAVFHSAPYDALQASALSSIVSLLAQAPSMKRKRIGTHIELLCAEYDVAIPAVSCFTKQEASTFLHVDACVLNKMPLARVAPRSTTRHFRPVDVSMPYKMSLQRKGAPLYTFDAILRAALITHEDLNVLVPHLRKAVGVDQLHYDRAVTAQEFIAHAAVAHCVSVQRVDYCLSACSDVEAFRRGLWEKSFDEYVPLVLRLIKMHVKLDRCYRFLLQMDGNARLKAKRLLVKLLRSGSFSASAYVKSLQANLWWAKSEKNLRKMRGFAARGLY